MFVKQAGHKPSHNALDQAFWHSLACAVRKRAPEFKKRVGKAELLDHLWNVVKEEYWSVDPEIVDDCFRSVRSAAQETIEGEGWTTGKQQHRGVRNEKRDWLKSKGWTRIPHKSTVRRYAVDEAEDSEEEPEDGFEDDVEGGMVGAHLTGQQEVTGFLNSDDGEE